MKKVLIGVDICCVQRLCVQHFEVELAALVASASEANKAANLAKERRSLDAPGEEEAEAAGDGIEADDEPQPTVPDALFRELEQCNLLPMKWWLGYDEHIPLPSDWEAILDIASQRTYYWHRPTKTVTWEQPAPPQVSSVAKRAAAADGRGQPIELLKSTEEVTIIADNVLLVSLLMPYHYLAADPMGASRRRILLPHHVLLAADRRQQYTQCVSPQ